MFRAAEPTQGELDLWFGTLEAFDEGEAAAFIALVDRGQSAQEAADSVMDVGGLADMTLEEYAYELVDDIGVESLTGTTSIMRGLDATFGSRGATRCTCKR